ncbi:MAG: hypothetical protein F4Z79_00230 [Acidimicrobiia bacterium]|nr:hypothetical protein [Acidimicrobiia bacterium]MYA38367.1 hypothetical protein [Acidimicrobiia bacterium]MYB78049.1 hypothetical protein [Acidimicrobiia bacterium]MYG91526.1 hypothetical protein [Acidimicrobiia bacterium]
MAATQQIQDHVDRNYAAFAALLPDLLRGNAGQWALLRNENLEAIFDTVRDAHTAGQKLYPDGLFSIQEIRPGAVDLGWFSHALP